MSPIWDSVIRCNEPKNTDKTDTNFKDHQNLYWWYSIVGTHSSASPNSASGSGPLTTRREWACIYWYCTDLLIICNISTTVVVIFTGTLAKVNVRRLADLAHWDFHVHTVEDLWRLLDRMELHTICNLADSSRPAATRPQVYQRQ